VLVLDMWGINPARQLDGAIIGPKDSL
jgi:hypothetical protein